MLKGQISYVTGFGNEKPPSAIVINTYTHTDTHTQHIHMEYVFVVLGNNINHIKLKRVSYHCGEDNASENIREREPRG